MAGAAHLQLREVLDVRVDHLGEPPQQPTAVGRGEGRPLALGRRCALDGPVGLLDVGELDGLDDLLGRRVEDVVGVLLAHGHSLSNPRKRSQSVTADSKAASSTSAAFT